MHWRSYFIALGSFAIVAGLDAQTALLAHPFPPFHMFGSKSAYPERQVPARLCLIDEPKACFRLPIAGKGDDAFTYFWRPKAKVVRTISGENLTLFSATLPGGSGSSTEYTLLRYGNNKLTNLLPKFILSNQSNLVLWDIPSISNMPVIVTADFIWEDGAHYGPHRSTVSAYRYDCGTNKYRLILTYDTHHIFPGYDNFDHTYPVLEHERKTILAKLAQLPHQ